ncbi:MAG: seg [Parcubacteria group bacterium]|nr:seg [Parcubacteria group bacterium]
MWTLFERVAQARPNPIQCGYLHMDPLARLFGSYARLKLLRLFLFNDDMSFTVVDIIERTKTPKDAVRKEITALVACGVIRKRTGKGAAQFIANRKFQYFDALQSFIRSTTNLSDADMVASFKRAGAIRLVVLSGLFTGALEAKVDILIVGDKLEDKPLESSIRALEAEFGRELRFASFSTEDFKYRRGVYDRLLRDIFDFPHRVIFDRLGL